MITAPVLDELDWLVHGFGLRESAHPAQTLLPRQIHSAIVLDAPGDADWEQAPPEGDALVCSRTGTVIGVKTADCVPILLADPVTRTVAAIHAGWRGTAAGIAGAAVRRMAELHGVNPADLRAAIGPSIGICCYEVGPDVASRFGIECAKIAHLDLPLRNEQQLREAGLSRIWRSGECTFCRSDRFFSFRREKEQAGRMVSFIGQTNSTDARNARP